MQVSTVSSYYGPATTGTKSATGAKATPDAGDASSLQGSDASSLSNSVEQQFLKYAQMNPIDRMRANILKDMNLTEDDLKNMPPDQRSAVEQKIKDLIEQQLKKTTEKGQLVDVSA